ncbi:hypothetical protein BpHYR1_004912 [Brachionus plicatilis]|uniref:Uncharacterized protein n=1 Tax=Brachionus plicatilis TaxID=10195 RepID=A0A3M7SKC0_BRAPC|nr:hypothetical protein BpHYR1_004912 [Brachionus plicatilis]
MSKLNENEMVFLLFFSLTTIIGDLNMDHKSGENCLVVLSVIINLYWALFLFPLKDLILPLHILG